MKRSQTPSRPQHARGASLGRPSPPRLRKGKAAQTGKWSASDDHPTGTASARAGSGHPFPPSTPSRSCLSSHLGNSWAQKSLFSGLFWEPALFLETQLGLGPLTLWLGVCRPGFSSQLCHFLALRPWPSCFPVWTCSPSVKWGDNPPTAASEKKHGQS